jgi:hypothetical protein
MPLITRRSSARGLPGRPVGRCGSIAAHVSSESQKRLLDDAMPASNLAFT